MSAEYDRELARHNRRRGKTPNPFSQEQLRHELATIKEGISFVLSGNLEFKAAVIFGSFASGDADLYSDIDLMLFRSVGEHFPDQEEDTIDSLKRAGGGFNVTIHFYFPLSEDVLNRRLNELKPFIKDGFIVIAPKQEDAQLISSVFNRLHT